LPLTLVSIHFSSQEVISLKGRSVKVKGLLDSGSLAGDFISQDIVESFDLNSFVNLNKSNKKVFSGLDNSCSISVGTLTASMLFINELTNKSKILTLILIVL
jgi:hypothetical protein